MTSTNAALTRSLRLKVKPEGAAWLNRASRNAKEARRLAFDTLRCWFDVEWIDTRVLRLRKHRGYLMGLYDGHASIIRSVEGLL